MKALRIRDREDVYPDSPTESTADALEDEDGNATPLPEDGIDTPIPDDSQQQPSPASPVESPPPPTGWSPVQNPALHQTPLPFHPVV